MINKIIELLPIIPCQEATRLMSISMERRLSIKETLDLKLHLMICVLCVEFQKQIGFFRKLLRNYESVGERNLLPEEKIRIKQSLKNN